MFCPVGSPHAKAAILASCLAICASLLPAQDSPVYSRTRELEESHSQAEQQAEQTVSLSAERLITLLQNETGLLLEVKKLLVRKAFEQGRILEPEDLTDEALFRLLGEDENIRVLATQEVSRRRYIRALPTADERRRQPAVGGNSLKAKGEESSTSGTGAKNRNTSQEERYWSDQEQRRDVSPQQVVPPYNPHAPDGSPGNQPEPAPDSRRAVEQAQMQDSDEVDSMPTDSGSMERIRPQDLPELIRARCEPTMPGLGSSSGGSMSQQTVPDASRLPTYPSLTQPGG